MPAGPATVFAHYLPGPLSDEAGLSVARRWMEVLLQAIRDDFARPTVHARNLFHLSAAMYDAWAAYSTTARPYLFGDAEVPCLRSALPEDGAGRDAQEAAISHAAWRLIRHRFRHSPGAAATQRNADTLMAALGHHEENDSAAAALGRCIGDHYIARGLADGSNEASDYASTVYRPINNYLDPAYPGDAGLDDPDRWQPLALPLFVDQAGNPADGIHEFVTPEWGHVTPFALYAERGVGTVRIYADIGKSVNGKPWQRFTDSEVDLAAVDGMNWLGDERWLLRPERTQAVPGLAPDWYPPITAARFGAMLDALGEPRPASEAEAAAVRRAPE